MAKGSAQLIDSVLDMVPDSVSEMTYLKNKAKLSGAVLGKQLLQTVVNGWVHILQVLQGRLMPHQLPVHTVCPFSHIVGLTAHLTGELTMSYGCHHIAGLRHIRKACRRMSSSVLVSRQCCKKWL